MPRAPLQFSSIVCAHCGAIIALIARPEVITHTTHLRCAQCLAVRTVKIVDAPRNQVYTELQQPA